MSVLFANVLDLINSIKSINSIGLIESITYIQSSREVVGLPSTMASLVYLSSRVPGYQSTILVSLVNGKRPASLQIVHLRIYVEGSLIEKKFEPTNKLQYTFVWNRNDAYQLPVYGQSQAKGTCYFIPKIYRTDIGILYVDLSSLIIDTTLHINILHKNNT